MAFERPSLTEIVDRVEQDFLSRLPLVGAVLRRSIVYVLSRVLAGAVHMLHGHLDFLSRQIFADTAEGEYLERWAVLFGLERLAPTYAEGTSIVYGTNATIIPISTVLLRSDGSEYTVDAQVTIATLTAWANTTGYTVGQLRSNSGNIYLCITAGTSAGSGGPTTTAVDITDGTVHWMYIASGSAAVTASVTASTAGADGTLTAGEVLTLESPISGATSTTTVAGSTSDGTDEEEDEALRTRVLERLQDPPHGGTAADYEAWAKEVAGVTRVWVTAQGMGPGTVLVYFVRDDDASIIPSVGEVSDVQDKLDEEAPAHCTPTAAAPTAVTLDFTVDDNGDDSARDAVEAELADLVLRMAEPGVTIPVEYLRAAVSNADSGLNYAMTIPAGDPSVTTGQLLVFGTVTWI